jgi:hypothetical protein
MTEPGYRKSSFCGTSACVEVAFTHSSYCGSNSCVEVGHDGDDVLVRDSKNPGAAPLQFTAEEWRAFLAGARDGEFDA